MTQYKVTVAIMELDSNTGIVNPIRKDFSGKFFYSAHEAIEDYIKALSNPFAHDIKIESVEV